MFTAEFLPQSIFGHPQYEYMYVVYATHILYTVLNQLDFSNIDLPFYSNSRSSILVYNYEIRVFRSLLRYVCPLKVKNVNISSREEEPSFFLFFPSSDTSLTVTGGTVSMLFGFVYRICLQRPHPHLNGPLIRVC